jgi:acetylglutamate synthase
MAVLEVAKIQVRSGLQENLPALDTGEFGWCVDTQRLFIGKGTLAEGAPQTGVTEILTEYSDNSYADDILALEANVANLTANVATLTSVVGNLAPQTVTLTNNTTANIAAITIPSANSRIISYSIERNNAMRIGSIKVTNFANVVSYDDDYSETTSTGITLSFSSTNPVVMSYTSDNAGYVANLTYVYQHLRTIPY